MHDSGFSAARASAALWSFLNLNVGLQGDARTKFDQAKELHGLDVWRRIVVPIEPKTTARRVAMHTDIHGPARAKKISETIDHIGLWEKELERYYEMGGQVIPEEEKVVILLKMLPSDTPGWMVQALEDMNEYESMKSRLDKNITFMSDHSGSHNMRVNLVSGEESAHPTEEPGGGETRGWEAEGPGQEVDLTGLAAERQDEVLAVMLARGAFEAASARETAMLSEPAHRPRRHWGARGQ